MLLLIANAKTLWFVTRGSGVVALLLLTASVLLGTGVALRWRGRPWPRFALVNTHRNLTLLSIVFVTIHVVTTVADGYAPISFVAAVVPFASPYRPLWLAFGTISFDLLLALVITSLARTWIKPKLWRGLHYSAYVAWPVAVLHSFGTGSDARATWLAVLGSVCVAAVVLAVLARAVRGPGRQLIRGIGAAVALIVPVALLLWYQSGPLQRGWAKRAGTPAVLLAHAAPTHDASLAGVLPSAPTSFVSALSGRIDQTQVPGGLVNVRISLRLRGGPKGAARIALRGVPVGSGGVSMTASGVSFVPATTRQIYTGQVVGLDGAQVVADVQDGAGDRLRLSFALRIGAGSKAVSGVVAGNARSGE